MPRWLRGLIKLLGLSRLSSTTASTGLMLLIGLSYLLQIRYQGGMSPKNFQETYTLGASFGPLTLGPQPWRAFSYTLVHGGLMHLGFNLFALSQIGPLIERWFGGARFLFGWFLGGAAGVVGPSLLGIESMVPVVGASGAISGLIGMAMIQGHLSKTPQGKQIRDVMIRWMLYTTIFGVMVGGAGINVAHGAHFGGLAGGLLVGWLLGPESPQYPDRRRLTPIIGALALLGILGCLIAHLSWFLGDREAPSLPDHPGLSQQLFDWSVQEQGLREAIHPEGRALLDEAKGASQAWLEELRGSIQALPIEQRWPTLLGIADSLSPELLVSLLRRTEALILMGELLPISWHMKSLEAKVKRRRAQTQNLKSMLSSQQGLSALPRSKPIKLQSQPPPGLRVGDQLLLKLQIEAEPKEAEEIQLSLELEGPLSSTAPLKQQLKLPPSGQLERWLPLEAKAVGEAELILGAEGPGRRGGESLFLPIYPLQAPETQWISGQLKAGEIQEVELPKELKELQLQLSASLLESLEPEAKRLSQLPYGALEQRVTRLLPFVALGELMQRQAQDWVSEQTWQELLAQEIRALSRLQGPDGGFKRWPEGADTSCSGSAYALLILGRLQSQGQKIRWIDLEAGGAYLLKAWPQASLDERALILLSLRALKRAQPELERRLFESRAALSFSAKALLLQSLNPEAGGQHLLEEILEAPELKSPEQPRSGSSLFQGEIYRQAMLLSALLSLRPKLPETQKLAQSLLKSLEKSDTESSPTAGFRLLALSQFAEQQEREQTDLKIDLSWAGGVLEEQLQGEQPGIIKRKLKRPEGLKLQSSGSGVLYYTLQFQHPKGACSQAQGGGIKLQRSLHSPGQEEALSQEITLDQRLELRVQLELTEARHHLLLSLPLPAGLALEGSPPPWAPLSQLKPNPLELRLFAEQLNSGRYDYRLPLRAHSQGRFAQPPAQLKEIYRDKCWAQSEGGSLEIKGSEAL